MRQINLIAITGQQVLVDPPERAPVALGIRLAHDPPPQGEMRRLRRAIGEELTPQPNEGRGVDIADHRAQLPVMVRDQRPVVEPHPHLRTGIGPHRQPLQTPPEVVAEVAHGPAGEGPVRGTACTGAGIQAALQHGQRVARPAMTGQGRVPFHPGHPALGLQGRPGPHHENVVTSGPVSRPTAIQPLTPGLPTDTAQQPGAIG